MLAVLVEWTMTPPNFFMLVVLVERTMIPPKFLMLVVLVEWTMTPSSMSKWPSMVGVAASALLVN